jgi:PKD repeat protein
MPPAPQVDEIVTFNGSALTGTMPISYSWNFGDGSAVQMGSSITHSFPLTVTTHIYTTSLTTANACSSNNLVQHAITVRPRTIYLPLMLKNP